MGHTWVVVAIVVGGAFTLAILIHFLNRESPPPSRKSVARGAAKPDAGAKADKDAKPGPEAEPKAGVSEPGSKRPSSSPGEAPRSEPGKPSSGRTSGVPDPTPQQKPAPPVMMPEKLHEDEDDDITIVTLTPRLDLMAAVAGIADASDDEDDEERLPGSEKPSAVPIIYDEDAAVDEPTHAHALILVSAVGQTDLGRKRKINEDRYLVLDEEHLYVVADGMGGHAGGEVASQCAVDTIAAAFKANKFEGDAFDNVPRRGAELAIAIQLANHAIYEQAKSDSKLQGMGTTIVSARFTPGKQRVYIGHVGDSRCYRYRSGQLTQITTDHTMAAMGMVGPFADHLSRAVGIGPSVTVDLVIAKPRHDDVFLLCSDGLSKMVKDADICEILAAHEDPNDAVSSLVERAKAQGGRDNITVILVVVKDPRGFARYVQINENKRKNGESAPPPKEGAPADATEVRKAKGAAEAPAPGAKPAAEVLAMDEEILRALSPLDKATDSGQVAARPSAPEARKSVPEARKHVPEARKSVPGEPPKPPKPKK